MTNEVTTTTQRREAMQVIDAVPILDTARFEHMQRIASIMAHSSMIPETLRTQGKSDNKQPLPYEQVLSNCFLVVNQATRWGMDPFSCISCCSVVHGRLAYEGKLVAAVLDAKIGVALHHYFTGDPAKDDYRIYLSDQPFTEHVINALKPGISIPGHNLWDGSVGEWKTAGTGTPWTPKNYRRMLIYRGTRDWARIYKPALMLGVYTDDELIDLAEDARARRATPVLSLSEKIAAARTSGQQAIEGFSREHVTNELTGTTLDIGATGAQSHPDRHEVSEQPSESDTDTSDGSVSDSSQPVLPATDKPASANTVPPARADAGNNSDSHQSRLPDATESASSGPVCDADSDESKLRRFSDYLFTYTTGNQSSLREPSIQWWKQNGGVPAQPSVLSKKMALVFKHHSSRIEKKMTADACRAEVEKEISK